jgi:hypothetical protein
MILVIYTKKDDLSSPLCCVVLTITNKGGILETKAAYHLLDIFFIFTCGKAFPV